MKLDDLIMEYGRAVDRAQREYSDWYAIACHNRKNNLPYIPFAGFNVDYVDFQTRIGQVIKEEFALNDKQVGYIMAEAYDRFHASFGDMFWGAYNLAEFCAKFPK